MGLQTTIRARVLQAEDVEIGDFVLNHGRVEAIRPDGMFLYFTIRGLLWVNGKGEWAAWEIIRHQVEDMWIKERKL